MCSTLALTASKETSPHAWSKLHPASSQEHRRWKHLHMRGANCSFRLPLPRREETSPHAWSKPVHRPGARSLGGNISTCVEQTGVHGLRRGVEEKHLHMRGANPLRNPLRIQPIETSPHAWSKRYRPTDGKTVSGNISTCVEQTNIVGKSKILHMETSPHAWSKLNKTLERIRQGGNISTCVEQTTSSRMTTISTEKHLHMRGANKYNGDVMTTGEETSPHAWSKQRHLGVSYQRYAICSSSNPR